jgi:hypothetical protein
MDKILAYFKKIFGKNVKYYKSSKGFYFYIPTNDIDTDVSYFIRIDSQSIKSDYKVYDTRVLFKYSWKDENDFLNYYKGKWILTYNDKLGKYKIPNDSIELEIELLT